MCFLFLSLILLRLLSVFLTKLVIYLFLFFYFSTFLRNFDEVFFSAVHYELYTVRISVEIFVSFLLMLLLRVVLFYFICLKRNARIA